MNAIGYGLAICSLWLPYVDPEPPVPVDGRTEVLVAQLGHDLYATREAASELLWRKTDFRQYPWLLQQRFQNPDPEIRSRLARIFRDHLADVLGSLEPYPCIDTTWAEVKARTSDGFVFTSTVLYPYSLGARSEYEPYLNKRLDGRGGESPPWLSYRLATRDLVEVWLERGVSLHYIKGRLRQLRVKEKCLFGEQYQDYLCRTDGLPLDKAELTKR